jgi:hypothetical protein
MLCKNIKLLLLAEKINTVKKKKVKKSHYRPGVAQTVPGS